ncbi:hypothetical protein [Mucilaginibacter sp.]
MENSSVAAVNRPLNCTYCNTAVAQPDNFCITCGYPINGTEEDQRFFVSERNALAIDLEDHHKKVNQAGKSLYWLAGATLVWGFIQYGITASKGIDNGELDKPLLLVNIILAALYLGLGLWSRKKPVAALVSGFSLYLIVQILGTIGDPAYLFKGIIIKILFVGYFIKGIKSAMEAERLKKQYYI